MAHAVPQRRRWTGLVFGQALAFALMVLCCAWLARELELIVPGHRILASFRFQERLGATLVWQLVAFAGAVWLLHALLGLAAFGLARLTEIAFPTVPAKHYWLVAGWFALLAGLAMAANATWFPASQFSSDPSWWRREIAGFEPVQLGAAALVTLVMLIMLRARSRLPNLRPGGMTAVVILVLAALVAVWPPPIRNAAAIAAEASPHIVIIGVDSLRNDLEAPHHGPAAMPSIRSFLESSRRFHDATTPLARTYASWVSILSGRHPVTTHARVNLMPRALVREGPTLGHALRSHRHGYRSVYATDEVRFANFDESFGFDQLITPPVGAIDFILGFLGDIPLVNLAASTPVGAWLFPSNHGNRAAFLTYRPQQFVDRLDRELVVEGPTFLAVHLTLAHWPYVWLGMPAPSNQPEYRDSFPIALAEVDQQFDAVIRVLSEKGVLDNAIVALLSDHGEALGAPSDSMLRRTGESREIWDSLWGHGTSVMSPNQYRVLLAIRAFGRARLPGPELNYDWPVSLEDVRPTLEELATGLAPLGVDGVSLLPYMTDPARARTLATRIRFTETDFNTPAIVAGQYETSGIIDEAAVYYELEPATGWVQFRPERLTDLLAQKQRAAFTSQHLLAAIPGSRGAGTRYLFTEHDDPHPRPVNVPPDPDKDKEARRLWDALHGRFPGELAPAS